MAYSDEPPRYISISALDASKRRSEDMKDLEHMRAEA